MTDWYAEESLPKFDTPPVSEVALAIEYAPIVGMDYFRLTRLQSMWEDEYPDITDANGAPPTPPKSDGGMLIAFGEQPRRIWAAGRENGLLVQTQTDRLILNWRKSFGPEAYPGYSPFLRGEFERLWAKLLTYLASVNLPAPIPLLAEFTYINAVPIIAQERVADFVTLIQAPPQDLPGTDSFGRFQFIRDVEQSEDHPFAQVHIAGEPQETPMGRQLFFTITARAILGDQGADPLQALDGVHALASHTFARVVTEEKQRLWGRTQ